MVKNLDNSELEAPSYYMLRTDEKEDIKDVLEHLNKCYYSYLPIDIINKLERSLKAINR